MKMDLKNAAPGLSGPADGKKIFFIRHGRTEWNDQFRYQGATDIVLSDTGKEQARKAGLRFENIGIDSIITSPLRRAHETADIISSFHQGLRPAVMQELTEVNFGGWEGLTVPQIVEQYGQDLFDRWRRDPLFTDAPDGESNEDLWERCGRAAAVIRSIPGKRIVVVGHGAMFRALFPKLLDMKRTGAFWKSRLDNCSVSVFACDGTERMSLSCLNDTNHLKIDDDSIKILPEP